METFTTDTEYVMETIGMKETHLNVQNHKSTDKSGNSTEDMALALFAKLPHSLKKQLYELYKIDFEMFDYDAKPFM